MGRLSGERRAIAAALLAMYGFLFLIQSLFAPEGFGLFFGALTLIYGMGFLGIVAGYFWARWFTIGLGLQGAMVGAMGLFQGWNDPNFPLEIFMFYTGTHLAVSAMLWGDAMAKAFDGRPEWRKRFHLDENATNRLGKAVIRVGASLPMVITYAFAPREGAVLALLGGGLILSGAWAMSQMRSWSLPAMAGGVVALIAAAFNGASQVQTHSYSIANLNVIGYIAIVGTLLVLTPFAKPVYNALTKDA